MWHFSSPVIAHKPYTSLGIPPEAGIDLMHDGSDCVCISAHSEIAWYQLWLATCLIGAEVDLSSTKMITFENGVQWSYGDAAECPLVT